jgi:hypothetical protein
MSFQKCPDEGQSTTRSADRSPEPEHSNRMTPVEALQAAQHLLGCFRHGDANDPIVYGTAIASIMASYPRDVVQFVCDPRTGLPGLMEWMPSVAAVKAACDARASELSKAKRYQHWGERQQLTNEQEAQQRKLEAARPTLDELHARHGKTWGIAQEVLKPTQSGAGMTLEKVTEHYKTHGLEFNPKLAPSLPEVPMSKGSTRG